MEEIILLINIICFIFSGSAYFFENSFYKYSYAVSDNRDFNNKFLFEMRQGVYEPQNEMAEMSINMSFLISLLSTYLILGFWATLLIFIILSFLGVKGILSAPFEYFFYSLNKNNKNIQRTLLRFNKFHKRIYQVSTYLSILVFIAIFYVLNTKLNFEFFSFPGLNISDNFLLKELFNTDKAYYLILPLALLIFTFIKLVLLKNYKIVVFDKYEELINYYWDTIRKYKNKEITYETYKSRVSDKSNIFLEYCCITIEDNIIRFKQK